MESKEIQVAVAGVRGYKGTELVRQIGRHPHFRVALIVSDAMTGQRLSDLDRSFLRDGEAGAVGYDDAVLAATQLGVKLMFLAADPERCVELAGKCIEAGIRVIDLSGAHALKKPQVHAETYGFPWSPHAAEALFGLTEHQDKGAFKDAALIADPGPYATSVLLGLQPIAKAGLLDPDSLVVDAKGGATVSGKKARMSLLFPEVSENCYPTKIGRHQYMPEIMQELEPFCDSAIRMSLSTHLIPVSRGVLTTAYIRVKHDGVEEAAHMLRKVLEESYKDSPFIQVLDRAEQVTLKAVVHSNRCVMGVSPDPWGGRVVLAVALDNLGKGTVGMALQNANLAFGLGEDVGLSKP